MNKQATTLKLQTGKLHIADFLIPELPLFIEISGNNYLPKLLKMKRAHNIPNINYYSLIEIENKELGLPTIEQQFSTLAQLIGKKVSPIEMSILSEKQLDTLVGKFITLYQNVK